MTDDQEAAQKAALAQSEKAHGMEIRNQNGRVIGAASGDPAWVRRQLAELQGLGALEETAKLRPVLRIVAAEDTAER